MPAFDNGKDGFLKILRWALWWCVVTVITVAILYGTAYMFGHQAAGVNQAIEDQKALFVFHKMTTSVLVAGIGMVVIFIYLVLENIGRIITKKTAKEFLEKSRLWVGYSVIACVILTLFGAPLFNFFWNDYFEDNGYVQCSGVIHLPDEMLNAVWAREARWCRDEKVSDLLIEEGHGQSGVEKVNEYLMQAREDTTASMQGD